MKNYQNLISFIILWSLVILGVNSANAAYQIGYMYIQNRVHQDGRHYNKLYFEMKTDSGAYISNTNVVDAVKLISPEQEEVDLGPLVFQPNYEIILGQYDCSNSRITYSSPQIINDYHAVINDSLITGTYRLEVTADDDETYTQDYLFEQAVDLPYIDSDTFEIRADASGNVFWTWNIPDSLSTEIMSQGISIASRAFIEIYNNDQ